MPHRKKHGPEEHEGEPKVETQQDQTGQTESAADETQALKAQIEQLQEQLKEAENERLRGLAEFRNYRRRTEDEKSLFRQLATENLVTELLPVLDNFERSLAHMQSGAPPEKVLEGIRMVEKQLRSVLESQNVRRIEAVGIPFDPDLHEAVSMGPSEEHEEDTVIAELEPGYRMGNKVIRPARVKVAKNG